jgi:poly-gamma-glutamate synthesis protein (capsule biosynthesis protein)
VAARLARLLLLVLLIARLAGGGDERPSDPGGRLVVQAVGDLMLAGSAEATMRRRGYHWAFDGTRGLLADGDLNIANLEAPVTRRGRPVTKEYTFRQNPDSLPALHHAGIRMVALGNNHTGDYGEQGLLDTIGHLAAAGIGYAGAGRDLASARQPARVEVRGRRVAMLSYSLTFPKEFYADRRRPGTPFGHEGWVRADVQRSKATADIVLVCFHWGAELMTEPKDYQRLVGRAAIEAGADAVFGSHPHVLQGVELVAGRPIFYSLGNYAFGSSGSAAEGALARLVFDDANRLEAVLARPLDVRNDRVAYNPRPADGRHGAAIVEALAARSRLLGVTVVEEDGWAKVVLPGR